MKISLETAALWTALVLSIMTVTWFTYSSDRVKSWTVMILPGNQEGLFRVDTGKLLFLLP